MLMIALAPTPSIASVPPAVAVELLVLRAAAVVAARLAMIAMVAVLSVIPVLRSLRLVARRRGPWLARRLPRFGGLLGSRWRGSRGSVLGRYGRDGRRRRGVDGDVGTGWCVRSRIAVRIRLALFGGIATILARPSAATVRASAFGHATRFVMGCFYSRLCAGIPPRYVAVLL